MLLLHSISFNSSTPTHKGVLCRMAFHPYIKNLGVGVNKYMTQCFFCQKSHIAANSVPHSKHKTTRVMRANLQKRSVHGKRINVCTTCIKSSATLRQI